MPEFSQSEFETAAGSAREQFGAGAEIEAIQTFWNWLMGGQAAQPETFEPDPNKSAVENLAEAQRISRANEALPPSGPGAPLQALLTPALAGAKTLESRVESRLASQGAGGTGIGTIAGAAGESAGGFAMSDLMRRLFSMATGLGTGATQRAAGVTGPASQYVRPTGQEQFFGALGTATQFLPVPRFPKSKNGGEGRLT